MDGGCETASLNATLAAARAALAALSLGDVHLASYLPRNADGTIRLPPAGPFFVLIDILDSPTFEWGTLKYHNADLQVNAYSNDPSVALANAEAARNALLAIRHQPGILRRIPAPDGATLPGYLVTTRSGHA